MSALDKFTARVAPDNREKFAKCATKWSHLANCIGWNNLASMYVRRVPPFQDAKPLTGSHKAKIRQARQILLNECVADLRDNGLEVSPATK